VNSYGRLPGFLPSAVLHTDSVLTGTVTRPALTSEGDAVRVDLQHCGGSVLATVSGPEVPGEGLPYQASADTATWQVTLSHATKPIAVRVRTFSVIDSRGHVYRPRLVPGQPRPPRSIRPGQTAHFELRVVLAVGEGMIRWAPVDRDLLATWDFVVEND
jgi:hypothetical protein